MEDFGFVVLMLILGSPVFLFICHMLGELPRELLGVVVRKVCRLPQYHKSAGPFSMLGLMASTATRLEVLENSLRILRVIEKHPWAYPPSHVKMVIERLDYAEWLVVHRDRSAEEDRWEYARTERARQRQREQQRTDKNAAVPRQGWRSILGLPPGEQNVQVVKRAYRKLAQQVHPDRGGSNEAMVRLNLAMQQARAELAFT